MTKRTDPATRASSASEIRMFFVGSGLAALRARRVVAFVAWAPSATPPASSTAMTWMTGSAVCEVAARATSAAAGGRMNVCTMSQTLSSQGHLSATNSTRYMPPARPTTSQLPSTSSPMSSAPSIVRVSIWQSPFTRSLLNNRTRRAETT